MIAHLLRSYIAIATAAKPNRPANTPEANDIDLSAAPVDPLELLFEAAAPAAAAPSVAFDPLSKVVSTGAESLEFDEVSI